MTPLVLLVGFLGSGKTTYLRGLLPLLRQRGLDPHVIINDYQNAKVDAQLLDGLAESIVPITGSCVCCGSRDELMTALEAFEPAPGRVVIVEANGTTDAEELVELLSLDPALDRFTLPIQISLIDGKRWQRRFWHNALELDQARTANFLHVSRRDEIDPKRIAGIFESMKQHGIEAAEASPDALAGEIAAVAAEVADVSGRLANGGHECDGACECHHDHHHDHDHDEDHEHDHHAHHFASCQIEFPGLVERAALEAFLDELPAEVIRAKGLVRLAGSPEQYHVFQKLDRFESAQVLSIGTSSRLSRPVGVFIGPRLDEEDLRMKVAGLAGGVPAR